MHISDLKAYADSAAPYIDDRQVERFHRWKYRRPQYRSKPELSELPADQQSPHLYKGIFIDIYV